MVASTKSVPGWPWASYSGGKRKEGTIPEKDEGTLKAESIARVEHVHIHVMQVLAGEIPEDAPVDFVLTDEMKQSGRPWWWGDSFKPTQEQLDAVAEQHNEDVARREAQSKLPPSEPE